MSRLPSDEFKIHSTSEPGQKQFFRSYYAPAPLRLRLYAYWIDSLLITLVSALFLAAANIRDQNQAAVLTLVLFWGYRTVCHGFYERTLGKKLMSLRVVRAGSDAKASWGAILLRETIGRALVVVTLSLGYLWALVSDNNLALHDIVSKTQVINEGLDRKFSIMGFLVKVIAVGTSLAATTVGLLIFSPLPIKSLQKNLELQGIDARGFSGSLYSGISIEHIGHKTTDLTWELKNIEFKYDLIDYIKSQKIEKIVVGGGSFETHHSLQNLALLYQSKAKPQPIPSPNKQADEPTKPPTSRHPFKLGIEQIDLSELMLKSQDFSANLKRFVISKMHLQKEQAQWHQLYIDSPSFLVNSGPVEWSREGGIKMTNQALIELRPALYKKIKKPIRVFAFAQYSKGQPLQASINGFDNRLQAQFANGNVALKVYDLSPSQYFHTSLPVERISLSVSQPTPTLLMTAYQLPFSFYINENKIDVHKNTFKPKHSSYNNAFTTSVVEVVQSLTSDRPPFRMISGEESRKAVYLADLYYGRPVDQLTVAQRKRIFIGEKYFDFNRNDQFHRLHQLQKELQLRSPATAQSEF